MTFGLSFVPLVLLAGASVDMSRAISERSQLAHATDAAVLAAAQNMRTATVQQLASTATSTLQANSDGTNSTYALNGQPTINADKTELCINTQATIPTMFMRIANINTVALNAKSCAKVGGTTYEVALVLDNTGSMANGNKIGSLKTAASNLIDTLLPGGTNNDYVKISLVPFNNAVKAFNPDTIATPGDTNEATRYNNIAYLDTLGQSSIHWENFPKVAGGVFQPQSRFELFQNLGIKWAGCIEERPGVYALNDQAPNPTNPDSLFVPYFAPDEGDNTYYTSNNYMSDNGNSVCAANDVYAQRDQQSPYAGDGQSKLCKYKAGTKTVTTTIPGACHTESQPYTYWTWEQQQTCTTNKKGKTSCTTNWVYVQKTGYQDTQVCDPDTYETTTVPLSLSVSTSGGKGPNQYCTIQALQPITNDAVALKTQINTMVASGNTNIISGFMWGWRTLSPNGPYSGVEPYTKPNHKKVIVLMTDGTNTWGTDSNWNGSDYSPFGYFWNNRLGADSAVGTVKASNVRTYMDNKLRTACANAKAAGIVIYTVGFSVSTDPIDSQGLQLLKDCATTPSNYYVASNGTGLADAFNNIGNSITGLRVSQ